MADEQPGHPDLPSDEELKFLSRLPDGAQARISLEGTRAEAEFHAHAMGYHLADHEDDHDPGTVNDKKYKLMGMCSRLTHRVLRSYFEELKALPIPPGAIRRLLYHILANITIRLFQEKWREYVPPDPDESQTRFLGAAIEHQRPLIEEYYAEALRIHEKRLSQYLKTGAEPQWSKSKPEAPKPGPEPEPEKSEHRSPKEFIDTYKLRPKRSYEKLASYIGISKDTMYAITKESRWVSAQTYRMVATVCGCKPEDLHPRDFPRPERWRP